MAESSSSPDMSPIDSCDCVGYLTHAVTRLILREVDRELRPLNLSAAQLAPLLALSEHGPMRQRDIVKVMAVAQPAMVAMLAKLERDCLIERRRDERDGRAALITLTEQGRDIVEKAYPTLRSCNERALTAFSAEEQAVFIGLLSRLIVDLDGEKP